ncbi:MAG: hypothetical protein IPI82_14575 [Candidatus Microthrix sp.]|nr:hypothetical protein [Candidatus Microthrix sp.]MBK7323625.1 hypothetical protein [Candidatus Microthrix sp.]
MHPLLSRIWTTAAHWFIWGGRPDGLPPFTTDRGRPAFFSRPVQGRPGLAAALSTNHWVVDWAVRSLGVATALGRDLNLFTMKLLANETDTVVAWKVIRAHRGWHRPALVLVSAIGDVARLT